MVGFNLDYSYSCFCGFYVLARGDFIISILSYIFTNKQLPDGAPDECCRVSSNELKAFIDKDFKEKEKNYPKGSDSSRLVRSTGIEARTETAQSLINKGFRGNRQDKNPRPPHSDFPDVWKI